VKIVQLGANRGNDHVTDIVRANPIEFLLLVEPHPVAAKLLRECYAGTPIAQIEEVAIVSVPTDNTVDFFYVDVPNPNYELSSLKKSHLHKHGVSEDSIKYIQVRCSTLYQLFQKYAVYNLDYLFMDIEGAEEDIIMSLNFNEYDIKHIWIEHIHLQNMDKLTTYLTSFGYKYTRTTGLDTIYSRDNM
jgi:FkbM family methyltransferase